MVSGWRVNGSLDELRRCRLMVLRSTTCLLLGRVTGSLR
jgi:hypothetical protein